MRRFEELESNLQQEIKSTLRVYDKVDVFYENGRYHFGACIKKEYAPDHEYIGTYRASEIFTAEERIINYVESFHEFPIEYKGKRDYRMLKEMTWETKVRLDENGDLALA